MHENKYYKTELLEALIGNDAKMICVPDNVLENICDHTTFEPFSEDILEYKVILMKTMMDIIYEEIKKLTPAQQEIIHHYFFLGKRIKHISHELNLRIPTLVERKDGALKKLRTRLSKHPVFLQIYAQYKEDDLPPGWMKK